MRIAIIGSRDIGEDYYSELTKHIPLNCTEIVSGGAEGIDKLAERYARENDLLLKVFIPDYAKYGKRAPLVRDEEIIEYAQAVYAFWDNESRGTAYTIAQCLEKQKEIRVHIVRKKRTYIGIVRKKNLHRHRKEKEPA